MRNHTDGRLRVHCLNSEKERQACAFHMDSDHVDRIRYALEEIQSQEVDSVDNAFGQRSISLFRVCGRCFVLGVSRRTAENIDTRDRHDENMMHRKPRPMPAL